MFRRNPDASELIDHVHAHRRKGVINVEFEIRGTGFGQKSLGFGSRFFDVASVTREFGKLFRRQRER